MRWVNLEIALRRLQEKRAGLFWAGVAEAFAAIGILTITALWVTSSLALPTADLLRSLAEVGVALLLGYVVEAVWMVNNAERKTWHRNWLGFVYGLGLAGLSGVTAALVTAAHLEATDGGLLDRAGFWWAAISLFVLGVLLVLQPLLVDQQVEKKQP